jgi:alpha,alpha-trehalase
MIDLFFSCVFLSYLLPIPTLHGTPCHHPPPLTFFTIIIWCPTAKNSDWCEQGSNASYCAGPLLQLVQLSEIYGDSKTFSDKPTRLGVNQTFQAFGELPQNATYGDVLEFAEEYFVSLTLLYLTF